MTARAARDLRIGCVGYLNARPLIHGWPGNVHFDHPAALCAKLAAGELDVALVSSFEYLRDPSYTIVDQIAIASDGPVYSVIVASTKPFEELEEIELDPASVTSVNLLRCLSNAEVTTSAGIARLMIGDRAIRFRAEHQSTYRITDLGELWRERTSLPFVYALWLVRPGVDAASVAEQLRDLRDRNLQRIEELAAGQRDFAPEFVRRYWTEYLKFSFADREKEGLIKFRSLCQEQGVLPPNSAPLKLV